MKRIRAWLALLLFLHAVVHPLVHTAPLLATASGPTTLSAPFAEKHSHTRDCELCRTANRVVPTVTFTGPAVRDSSSLVVTDPVFDVLAAAQPHLLARAPPVS